MYVIRQEHVRKTHTKIREKIKENYMKGFGGNKGKGEMIQPFHSQTILQYFEILETFWYTCLKLY